VFYIRILLFSQASSACWCV